MMSLDIFGDSQLPNGWTKVSLGLLRQQSGRIFDPLKAAEAKFELYSVPSHEFRRPEIVSGSEIGSTKQHVSSGDVLLSKINPKLNRAWVVGCFTEYPKIASTEWITFGKTTGINPRWLCYLLQTHRIRDYLAHNASGVGGSLTRVKPSLMDEVFVGLPPEQEQHRIVAKIEELFSELDQGVASLKTAREQLKVYRQSLLKNAFEGKLTAAWRAAHADQLETAAVLQQRIARERQARYQQQLADWQTAGQAGPKPKPPKPLPPLTAEELAQLPELPEGWGWARLLDACEEVVDCHNKTAPYLPKGIPLVRTPSIRDMRLNFDDSIRYISQETYAHWSRRCPPLPGDILFTREAPMGEAALIPDGKMVCMGQRIMLLRPGKFLSGKYLLCATQNPFFKKISDKVAVGTGVKHLRVGDVERLVFPICSQLEQREIADQLDAKLSEADQLDQTLATALQQADALRQSILKKAFCGQLVKQDKNDEPATALLERIRTGKSNGMNSPRSRRKSG